MELLQMEGEPVRTCPFYRLFCQKLAVYENILFFYKERVLSHAINLGLRLPAL